ncbi:MAG: polysaccharide deacetylase family protein [Verrucomicrobiota bacterium]
MQTILRNREALGIPDQTIALTFDDGPVPHGQTHALLDLLKSEGIRAGFCLVGRRVPTDPDLIRRMDEEGHLLVNHGDRHSPAGRMTDVDFQRDLVAFDERGSAVLSRDWLSTHYRPPGGRWTPRLRRLLTASGRTLMPMTYFAWDIFPFPYRQHLILAGMLAHLRRNQGGLFMLHEAIVPLSGEQSPAPPRNDRHWIIDLAKEFITTAKREGYHFDHPSDVIGSSETS